MTPMHPDRMDRRQGRSTLLRAAVPTAPRPRRWALRYGVIFGLAVALTALVVVVRGQALPMNGPGLLIYQLHDTVWLPLQGRFWTALFPDALIWFVVVIGLLGLVLSEFLGLVAPIRLAQVRIIRVLLRLSPGALVASHHALGAIGQRMALVEQVLRDMRDDALFAFTRALEADAEGHRFRQLCRLQLLQLRFGLERQRDVVSVIDTLGLAALDPDRRGDTAEPLKKAAQTLTPQAVPFWEAMLERPLLQTDLGDTLDAVATLGADGASPAALACKTVSIAVSTVIDGQAERLAWFDAWARLRAGQDTEISALLAQAEALCEFEFWAARAEAAAGRTATPKMLGEAFPGLGLVRSRGDIAAEVACSGGAP